VNVDGRLTGVALRRTDGRFGQRNPSAPAVVIPEFAVARSELAPTKIGVEVKILAKAMLKQIGRVDSDLRQKVSNIRNGGNTAISVGIVGISYAARYISFEVELKFPTTLPSTNPTLRGPPRTRSSQGPRTARDAPGGPDRWSTDQPGYGSGRLPLARNGFVR
jgi:hypothetical protein